ncbi:MAG: GNAT family N-acetyltransferase [Cyanobacteria bacterium P01_H01_bin.21]
MAQLFNVVIRPMRDDERRTVRAMMNRVFSLLDQWSFSFTPNVLVAEQDCQLVGAIVLKLFTLSHSHKVGAITWVFTIPEVRGQGLGQRLVEAGIDRCKQQGCDEVLTTVEGFNTSSSKLFSTRGFKRLSLGAQLRRYGLNTGWVWLNLAHYFDIGHFVWAYPDGSASDNPVWQWWGTIVVNSLIGLLMLWRLGDFNVIGPAIYLGLLLAFVVLFGARYLGMWLMARQQALTVRFRAWDSGYLLSAAIALIFAGAMYPIPGGVYPVTDQWRYRELLPKLGWIALAGNLPVLLIVWGAWILSQSGLFATDIQAWLDTLLLVGKPLVLFDSVMLVFPFVSFNGRRLWDWNKVVWATLAAGSVTVFFV